jgi:hypothetical protein
LGNYQKAVEFYQRQLASYNSSSISKGTMNAIWKQDVYREGNDIVVHDYKESFSMPTAPSANMYTSDLENTAPQYTGAAINPDIVHGNVQFIDMNTGQSGYWGPVLFRNPLSQNEHPMHPEADPDKWPNTYLVITRVANDIGKQAGETLLLNHNADPNFVYFRMYYTINDITNYTWGYVPRVVNYQAIWPDRP